MSQRIRPLAIGTVVLALVAVACGGESTQPGWTALPAGSGETSPSGEPASSETPGGSEAPGPSGGPQMTDESLGVEVAVDGLTEPTALAFAGPDDFFVTEKSTGEVHHVTGGGAGEPVLDLAVNSFDERGLLGIALHPDFASNGYMYLYWTASGEGEGDDGLLGPDTDADSTLPDLGNRIDRFVWDGSALTFDRNLVQLRSNTLKTDTSGRVRGNHDAGPLVFGTDGKLYAVIGDQNLRGQLQNIEDGSTPDDMSFTGVVLRLNDDGSVPEDNPFFAAGASLGGEAGENVQRIWAYGVRNSFGLAVHPETGALWETENGDDSWDEVNVFPAGANSGWIQLMGPPDRFDEYKQIEIDSEDGLDNPDYPPDMLAGNADEAQSRLFALDGSAYAAPVFSWKFPVAVTAIELVTSSSLGDASANTAWLGTVLSDVLLRYPLAADGGGFELDGGLADGVDDNTKKGDLGESAGYVVGTGFGVVTDIGLAPDGFLYVSSISNGAVYRIGPADQVGGEPAASPGASSPAASAPAGETVEVTVGTDTGGALQFDPASVTVPAGSSVSLVFENRSTSVPHNLTLGPPIDEATATIVDPGSSETLTFAAPDPGDYTFVCTLHPGMEGTLTVQ
ncbi:MAG TPA: PQQ-dependent sugar dehydrogenase [Candidatus Limnocylindrales bacterium]|nr:PQQ-dependent sugar dehydrogenase [Candidatus Limnocylindrales bacterium]